MLVKKYLNHLGNLSPLEIALVLVTLLLAVVGLVRFLPNFKGILDPVDLGFFHDAAVSMNTGNNPYGRGYIYPPFFAAMLRPLALLTLDLAAVVWLLFNSFCMLMTAWLGARTIGSNRGIFILALVIILLVPASSATLLLGQVNLLIAFLVVSTMFVSSQSKTSSSDLIAGTLLGLAAAIKVYPILFAVSFLFRRRYLALVSMLVTLGFTLLFGVIFGGGFQNTSSYFMDVLPRLMSRPLPNIANQSLNGMSVRLFSLRTYRFAVFEDSNLVTVTPNPVINMPELGIIVAQLLTGAALISSCVVLYLRIKSTGGKLPIFVDYAVLISTAFLITPIVLDVYYSLLLVPYLVILESRPLARQLIRLGAFLSMFLVIVGRFWHPLLFYLQSPLVTLFGLYGVVVIWATVLYATAKGLLARTRTASSPGDITLTAAPLDNRIRDKCLCPIDPRLLWCYT